MISASRAVLAIPSAAPARAARLIIAAVVLVALAAILYYVFAGGDDAADAGAGETQSPAVSVIAPGRGTVQGTINATGSLAARREMPVGVVGEGGRVVSVPVEAGQWVRAGQVLAGDRPLGADPADRQPRRQHRCRAGRRQPRAG